MPHGPSASWCVHKDITWYATLLYHVASGGDSAVSMMLENSNNVLPDIFSANVSLSPSLCRLDAGFAAHPSITGLYPEPADLILPVSNPNGYYHSSFWLQIDNETHVHSTATTIPRNTYRAVLQIFVSYHGDDEFWYTNPLRSAYHHQTLSSNLFTPQANGDFRQVYATVDDRFIGSHIQFAVLYPSSINSYF